MSTPNQASEPNDPRTMSPRSREQVADAVRALNWGQKAYLLGLLIAAHTPNWSTDALVVKAAAHVSVPIRSGWGN